MKEIKYKQSFLDSNIVLSTHSCNYILVRIRRYKFMINEHVTMALVYAFASKALGDYFDLHPHIQATSIELLQIHAIEGKMTPSKELRLVLTHREKILLNERDEIFSLKLFTGNCDNGKDIFTAECVWGIPNEDFLAQILMTNRFARIIEEYSHGSNQRSILLRFWTDYRLIVSSPNFNFSGCPPYRISGEFTVFLVSPRTDGTVLFDVSPAINKSEEV